MDYEPLKVLMSEKGCVEFKKPYSLNVVAVRNRKEENVFDDSLCIFWRSQDGIISIVNFPCSTTPGRSHLLKPKNKKGCAIICEGQFIRSHKLGRHRSKPALRQIRSIPVWRDNTKHGTPHYSKGVSLIYNDAQGINIHRASSSRIMRFVNRWSAGCIVLQNPGHMDALYALVSAQKQAGLGDKISLSVIDVSSMNVDKN